MVFIAGGVDYFKILNRILISKMDLLIGKETDQKHRI